MPDPLPRILLLALAAVCAIAGCATPARPNLAAVAIAIRPVGDRPPTADETRQVLQALQPALLRVGAAIAPSRADADFLMTVTFTPATASSGSRVLVNGIEPATRYKNATDAGDTPEAREWRRRLREIEGWAQSQNSGRDS